MEAISCRLHLPSQTPAIPDLPDHLPGHLELPEENGEIVENFRELPQSLLLSSAIWPVLERIHPDRHFAVGQIAESTGGSPTLPREGRSPRIGFMCPAFPPDLDGHYRRSYVLWKEHIAPAVIIEYASGDGTEERDRTPHEGKFWIYEQAVHGGLLRHHRGGNGRAGGLSTRRDQISAAPTQRTRALPDRATGSRPWHLARVFLERDSTLAAVVRHRW